MMEGRRALRLSLALNVVLVITAYLGFWSFTSGSDSHLARLCKLAGPAVPGTGDLDKLLDSSSPQLRPSCDVCNAGDIGKALCDQWGADTVARTLAFTDGNTRMKRVLSKWRSGQPVRLGVIGGSNSAGQGVWDDNQMVYSKLNMHVIFFNYLNKLFPQADGAVMDHTGASAQNSLVNGAQFGKASEYFVMCSQVHLPDDVDLIVVETAVNDQYTLDATQSHEFLIRALLERPGQPAVLELQTFGYDLARVLAGGGSHLASNLYYNIPTIAPRTLFYESAQQNITKFWDWFYWYNPHERPADLAGVDLRHFGPGGHKVAADLMAAYIDRQLCQMDNLEAEAGNSDVGNLYQTLPIPQLSLMSTFSRDHPDASVPKVHPTCQVIDSDTHPLIPKANDGWDKWTWRNDETGKEKHYLRATSPGATVTFQLPVVTSRVELYYLRSRSFGLGQVKCWLDDGKDEKVIEGFWDRDENIGQITRWTDVEEGEHTITCVLLDETTDPSGGKEFRIISLMSF